MLCLSLINIFAQGPDVDSLKRLLASTKEDTVKVQNIASSIVKENTVKL